MAFLERWQRRQETTPNKGSIPTAGSGDQKSGADADRWAVGKRVMVLGGGDTGVDCIATATRQVNIVATEKLSVEFFLLPRKGLTLQRYRVRGDF